MEFDDISAREMPHSIEAEQTVLGAVLLDSELLGTVMNLSLIHISEPTRH
mgnify:CR=1 FL=1